MDEVSKRLLVQVVGKLNDEQRLAVGFAYVWRKADGSLADDSGGYTIKQDGEMVAVDTRDVIDTPEAVREFEDSFYDFISSAKAGADDMHVDFDVAKVVGGLVFTAELNEALGLKGVMPEGALVAIRFPHTEKADALWAKVKAGERPQLSMVTVLEREEIDKAA